MNKFKLRLLYKYWQKILCMKQNYPFFVDYLTGIANCWIFSRLWNFQQIVGFSVDCGICNRLWDFQQNVGFTAECVILSRLWDFQQIAGFPADFCEIFSRLYDFQQIV